MAATGRMSGGAGLVPGSRVLADASFGLLAWALPLGAALITAPIVVRALGPVGYATYALALAYAAGAAAFGPGRSVIHVLSSASSVDQRRAVIGTGYAAALIVGAGTAAAFGLAAPLMSKAVGTLHAPSTDWALRLGALSALPASAVAVSLAMLQGLGRLDLMAMVGGGAALVTTTGAAIVASTGLGVTGVMAWQCVIGSVVAIACAWLVREVADRPALRVSWQVGRDLAHFSAAALAAQVSLAAWLVIERGVIGRVLGPADLTAYVVALMLGGYLQAAISAAAQVLSSSVRLGGAAGDALVAVYPVATKLVAALAVAGAAGIAGAGGPFLELWMGPSLARLAQPVLVPIALASCANSLATVSWFVNEAEGRPSRNAVLAAVWMVTGASALWILAPRWQLFGAGAARVIAQVLTVAAIVWVERASAGRLRGPWRALLVWVAPSGALLAWGLHASLSVLTLSWLTLTSTCAVGVALYAAVLWRSPLLDAHERAAVARWVAGIAARLLRAYTRRTPLRRGRYRLAATAGRLWPGPFPPATSSRDGRRFLINRASGMCDTLFFLGEYEPALTDFVRRIVRPGDVCVDVGANFGWYTTLLAALTGPAGAVHAFEPSPEAADWLERNLAQNGHPVNVRVNRAALGRDDGARAVLYQFEGLTLGHAALALGDRTPTRQADVPVMSLDAYLGRAEPRPVAFVKLDAEGAEADVLEGAADLLRGPAPPVWLIEMAVNTSRAFGRHPNDLLACLRGAAEYRFFGVDERHRALVKLDAFEPDDIGANVLCFPAARPMSPALLKRVRTRRPGDF